MLELVSDTFQPVAALDMALFTQAKELRQGLPVLYSGARGISAHDTIRLSTRHSTPVAHGKFGSQMWQ